MPRLYVERLYVEDLYRLGMNVR